MPRRFVCLFFSKLREPCFWYMLSLHDYSTFLFLEFQEDLANHSRTLATATFFEDFLDNSTDLLSTRRMPKSSVYNYFSGPSGPRFVEFGLFLTRGLRFVDSKGRFHKSKLRELGFREAFSFGVCSGRLFLEVLSFHS